MLLEMQSRWRGFLLGGAACHEARGDLAAVAQTLTADAVPAPRRLAVHRGTVSNSLVATLAAAYPALARLVGDSSFRFAALRFIAAVPPKAAQLWRYGAGFDGFLRSLPETSGMGWLADLAALEWAMHEAYFAADAAPLDPAGLSAVPQERVAGLRFSFLPSARRLATAWAALELRERALDVAVDPQSVTPEARAAQLLVLRASDAVTATAIAPADAAFIDILLAGGSLGAAAAAVPDDVQGALLRLLASRALAQFAFD